MDSHSLESAQLDGMSSKTNRINICNILSKMKLNQYISLKYALILVIWCQILPSGNSQNDLDSLSFFEASPVFHEKRFNTALGFTIGTYSAFSYGLYNVWYRQFEQESFHLFNDWGEWQNIDKFGHIYTAYFQGVLCYKGAKWTGLSEEKSILTGILCASLFQSTIEVMDGFSSAWGFSLTDMAANAIGVSAFALQQKHWGEQRILFKVSSWPKSYDNVVITSDDGQTTSDLITRTNDIYGTNYFESFLKDYNAQTIWASVNVHSFLADDNRWPSWLNLAIGYSAENMFGGYENTWEIDNRQFTLDPSYNRYQEFLIGFDVDLSRIKTKSHFLKTLLSVFNIFKVPSPALEINTQGELKLHFVYLN